jgi:hypothetical protein
MRKSKVTSEEVRAWADTLISKDVPSFDLKTGVDSRAYQTIGYLEGVIKALLNDRSEVHYYRAKIKGMAKCS